MTPAEIKSVCLTMVSAGLDTVPANIIQGLAYLATPHGQQLQEAAYSALMDVYGSPTEAWTAVLNEEKVPFISALVKETLRYYTVIAMSLPRTSIKPINYQGATIPAGTLFYMNARGADFDVSRFSNPYVFNPDRYIQDKSVTVHDCRSLTVDWGTSGHCSATLRLRRRITHVRWFASREPGVVCRFFPHDPSVQVI
jgi:phenylacetate 2-hydroxylase